MIKYQFSVKNNIGNKRFSFNIKKSSPKKKRESSKKGIMQSKEISYVNKTFENDSESKASFEFTKEVDIDKEIDGIQGTENNQNHLNSTNFISKRMFESFKRNSKKNSGIQNKKSGRNHPIQPSITNDVEFSGEQNNIGNNNQDSGIPFLTFTPPTPTPPVEQKSKFSDENLISEAEPSHQGKDKKKQILLKSNNFTNNKGKPNNNKNNKKEVKHKTLTDNNKKKKKDSNGNKPKSSTKSNNKPMKSVSQNAKENSVIIEFENKTENCSAPNQNETNGSFERKGFKRKSPEVLEVLPKINSKRESRITEALRLFKADKERGSKKSKASSSVTENRDLMMSRESVKDKYITTNYGPREVQDVKDVDGDDGSPPLVHFGNIPQDVDLIGATELLH